jgi:hypothetical protein
MGSGAGGSIQIHTSKIEGKGLVSAGGYGDEDADGHGGFGGGGRVLINYTDWYRFSEPENSI